MILRRSLLTLAAGTLLSAGCARGKLPPLVAPVTPRRRLLRSGNFRLGVLDFGSSDKEGQPGQNVYLTKAIPAMLATELKSAGRFAVHEGGGIRASGGAMAEQSAHEVVDGYVSGTVTSETAAETCFDVRLSNAFTQEILYAKSACIPVTRGAGTAAPDRAAVKRVADELSRAVKEVGNARVTAVDSKFVFISKGSESDVLPGMVAILVATGDASQSADRHKEIHLMTKVDPEAFDSAKVAVIIGEIAIVSVEKDYSVGVLYNGDYALPGDTAFFK